MFLATFEAAAKSSKGVVFVKSCVPRLLELSLRGTLPLEQTQRFFNVLISSSNSHWIDALAVAVAATGLQKSSSPILCAMVLMLFTPAAENSWLTAEGDDSVAGRIQRLTEVRGAALFLCASMF